MIEVKVCSDCAEEVRALNLTKTEEEQALHLLSIMRPNGMKRQLHSQILRRTYPCIEGFKKKIVPKLITVDGYYEPGAKSYDWSYTKPPKNLEIVTITNAKLIHRLETFEEDRKSRIPHHAVHDWIKKSACRLSPTPVSDEFAARATESGSTPALEQYFRGELFNDDAFSVNHYGRITHQIGQLPSKVRLNLCYGTEYTAEVDMAKSQINILAALFSDGCEQDTIRKHIADGTFYERCGTAFKSDDSLILRWNKKHPSKQIRSVKEWVNKCIYGNPKNKSNTYAKLEGDYPKFIKNLRGYYWEVVKKSRKEGKDNVQASKALARKIQKEEGEILLSVMEKCESLLIPVIPIFDGLLIPESQTAPVSNFFGEALEDRYNYAPKCHRVTSGHDCYR